MQNLKPMRIPTNRKIIVTPHTKTMTSLYCEIEILNICRSRFGTIRAALHWAAANAPINHENINSNEPKI